MILNLTKTALFTSLFFGTMTVSANTVTIQCKETLYHPLSPTVAYYHALDNQSESRATLNLKKEANGLYSIHFSGVLDFLTFVDTTIWSDAKVKENARIHFRETLQNIVAVPTKGPSIYHVTLAPTAVNETGFSCEFSKQNPKIFSCVKNQSKNKGRRIRIEASQYDNFNDGVHSSEHFVNVIREIPADYTDSVDVITETCRL